MMNNSASYILAIDQGTSGTGAYLYDSSGTIFAAADIPVKTHYPRPGWVEQDPYVILASVKQVVHEVIQKHNLKPGQITAVGLAHQGESLLLWDQQTGKPIYNVIIWQCVRSTDLVQTLIEAGHEQGFRARTGMPLDPEWPATKIRWVLRNVPEAVDLYKQGRLMYSQIDAWLINQLTQEKLFVTDHSMASRSGFYNIHQQEWDPELIDLFEADNLNLPELWDSDDFFGTMIINDAWSIPWRVNIIDQASALLGQACTSRGDAKVTYGSCAAFWYNLGSEPHLTKQLSTSIAWKSNSQATYAVVGETSAAGTVIAWLQDGLKIPWRLTELSDVAESVKEDEEILFVSALSGLGAPYWDRYTRGTIYGVTGATRLEHFVRAGLESIAFGVCDLADYFENVENLDLPDVIKVDGGMTANNYLMQFQADMLGKTIAVSNNQESTSMGVAFLTSNACGNYDGIENLKQSWKAKKIYEPRISAAEGEHKYHRWRDAVQNTILMHRP